MSEYIRHTGPEQCPLEFTAFYLDDDLATTWNTRASLRSQDAPRPRGQEVTAHHVEVGEGEHRPGTPDS